MNQPEALRKDEPLFWSTGRGTEVWALFLAIITGGLSTVTRLLEANPNLVRTHYAYRTPLYFAVRENQIEIVKLLLQRGGDPLSLAVNDSMLEITRDRGYTEMEALLQNEIDSRLGASERGEPMAAAIRGRDLGKVRALLDAEPELLHEGDKASNQPIHWAVMTRNLEIIDELISRGADLEKQRFDGARPIQLTNGDYHYRGWRDVPKDVSTTPREVLDHLRSKGAYCDICTAAYIGDLNRVKELVAENPYLANSVSEYITYYACSGTPVANAAGAGHLEIVSFLLEQGADPNLPEEGIAPRGKALYEAAAAGHLEIAKMLLAHGAFVNVPVESSADTLSRAMWRKDEEMVALLTSHGASRSVELLAYSGDTLVAAAVFEANPEKAKDSIAFSYAVSEGHENFVRLMLRYCPILAELHSGAAQTVELTELLIQHGMDANRPDWLEIRPLHQLARRGDIEKAKLLLRHGALLEVRDDDLCSTPLGWAAKFGQLEMVEFLLSEGAEAGKGDGPAWAAPLRWAERRGHAEIAALLRAHGAN